MYNSCRPESKLIKLLSQEKKFLLCDNPGKHTGTLGVEVLEKNTTNTIWWGLWYFNLGFKDHRDWGDQWLRCGHNYGFWLQDT
ncbi:hypothetical protein QFZ80_005867 [Paenibacillus sp. V4I7]|nr:hypothetical protein [Paenibacillus sp. V4I7]MDQ0919466.1 hypothetical protein [Paenibacillus sp. V4I5]